MSDTKKPEGLYSRSYSIPFEVVLERIKSKLTASGFTIFTVIDHSKAASGAGLEMFPASVIIFGNPAGGTALMKASPTLAIDLPSRILVTDQEGVKAYFNKMEYLKNRHFLQGNDQAVSKLDEKVISILENIE